MCPALGCASLVLHFEGQFPFTGGHGLLVSGRRLEAVEFAEEAREEGRKASSFLRVFEAPRPSEVLDADTGAALVVCKGSSRRVCARRAQELSGL